ncbi:imidazole glycerol phosphate synthase subunit HisH [Roseiterribacter gracilis]|uniref:Imidazole glycerol phosphate synthase subunit HisH n=1 Tax=Roseiterribacter gracilis TaxID=2812848 RepID=A0A8S8XIX7_9PROT|nr:imidazole glycerol phosphate synthase subunit HisH [Rhodospirillales bacterium TMPK1]
METIALVDVGSGNLRSAAKALERVAADLPGGATVHTTSDPDLVARADRIVLPGQGAFADVAAGLARIDGLRAALEHAVRANARPYLGICVGMQLMADRGREHGDHAGLGWIGGDVVPMTPSDPALKIPQMGWNDLDLLQPSHPVLRNVAAGEHAYFVHSYKFDVQDRADLLAQVDYGGGVAAIVGRDNLVGTQFHPEKSQAVGLKLLAAFLTWRP